MARWLLAGCLVGAAAGHAAANPGADQSAEYDTSRPVVQALPSPASGELNTALLRLARNSTDVDALTAAGTASLKLGDVDGAIGFFTRADSLSPRNFRVKAGLASAFVRSENPFDALLMFDEAERFGAAPAMLAADRALAHDLVGDNARARDLYRLALAQGPDDESRRRLAINLAIGGDRAGVEEVLRPLLDRRDLAAYRSRAFALAIMGDARGAQSIADVRLPRAAAQRIAPYLSYMPRLTPAQQVAAANFGHFPKAADIGRDDPRITSRVGAGGPRTTSADAGLIPRGEPLGKKLSAKDEKRAAREREARERDVHVGKSASGAAIAVATAAPTTRVIMPPAPPAAIPQPPRSPVPRPAAPIVARADARPGFSLTSSRPAISPMPPAVPAAVPPAAAQVPAAPAAPVQVVATPATSGPAAPVAAVSAPATAVVQPVPSAPVAEANQDEAAPQSVADAFADFLRAPPAPIQPVAGAVDLATITPRRDGQPVAAPAKDANGVKAVADAKKAKDAKDAKAAKDEKAKKPAPPKHPSRFWAQIATGRDTDALAFDWRKHSRAQAKLFKGRSPWVAKWGKTNRLLAGPFPSPKAAEAFLADAKKAGIDGFPFTSKEGEAVEPLGQ